MQRCMTVPNVRNPAPSQTVWIRAVNRARHRENAIRPARIKSKASYGLIETTRAQALVVFFLPVNGKKMPSPRKDNSQHQQAHDPIDTLAYRRCFSFSSLRPFGGQPEVCLPRPAAKVVVILHFACL